MKHKTKSGAARPLKKCPSTSRRFKTPLQAIAMVLLLVAAGSIALAQPTTPLNLDQPMIPSSGNDSDSPKQVPVDFAKVYVPDGFDSNDDVQFVGEGLFSHLCYKPAPTKVTVNEARKEIVVSPAAYLIKGLCLQIVLPFERVIDVGTIPPGDYSIVQESSNKQIGRLHVKPATKPQVDDYLYAPISQAFFRSHDSKNEILISGNFPNSCMSMKEIKVDVQQDVIVVQPIAAMSNSNCVNGQYPFEQSVTLDSIKAGRYLLHVRSMNGKAINNLVDAK